jgi:uncharacterized protein YydD (DUF2326 family)
MFLKTLIIASESEIIRKISFRKGINLIIDETPSGNKQLTGNNVGKTTVLKLVDFCLGGDSKNIYIDPETKRNEYTLVKDFLINNKVLITLILTDSLDRDDAKEIVIEKNFLARKEKIQKINGEKLTDDEFFSKLSSLIFPGHYTEKPTFKQIVSHNIRYTDESINNTLRILNKYTTDAEYETLYLFLFGCQFDKGNSKQEILLKLKQEYNYKSRMEDKQTKTAYMVALSLINSEIEELEKQKNTFNVNENFEADLEKLNNIKYQKSKTSSEISRLTIRKNLIIEAEEGLRASKEEIDLKQLELIYKQAISHVDGIQKTFDELVQYHNQMLDEKVKFITRELPELTNNIKAKEEYLNKLLAEEHSLSAIIAQTDFFKNLENIITQLNEKFRKKGEYENIIQQLNEIENNIKEYNKELEKIDKELFSDEFEKTVKIQIDKFNKHFASISNNLYREQYALKYDIITNKKNQRLYKFSTFNTNLSSGKKQGEISCFDIAYILFADDEDMPCLHFILNDKKELMHDNQLVRIAEFVNQHNIQFVSSMLKDKLPEELNNEDYFIVKLSQENKLFRIEPLEEFENLLLL